VLLLTMYLAPFVALALFLRARSRWASAGGAFAATDSAESGAWQTLRAAAAPRLGLATPVVASFALGVAVAWCAAGLSGAIVFSVGVLVSAFAAALVHAGRVAADGQEVRLRWNRSVALAQTLAAIQAGSLGALAWFFADPAGAIVLVVFAAGASATLLFVRVAAPSPDAESGAESPSAAWAMSSHLAAFAAAVMVAACAEAESLLPLGGLLAETETLRSELLLLPIAITLLSPLASAVAGPLAPRLFARSDDAGSFALERIAAVAMAVFLLGLVHWSGLSSSVAWTLLIGLAARQVAGLADEAAFRGGAGSYGIRSGTSAMPAIIAALAMLAGHGLAGIYGIALVALGMTSTFVAAGSAGNLRGPAGASPLANANATTAVAATLAVVAALAPVLAVASLRGGDALPSNLSDTLAAPALLAGVLAGAASAGSLSIRLSAGNGEDDRVRNAARVVAAAVLLPLLTSTVAGSAAASGMVLGFVAWAAASRVARRGPDGFGRPVLLAWGRVMALFALMSAPLMR
jgi:hypothetical protein